MQVGLLLHTMVIMLYITVAISKYNSKIFFKNLSLLTYIHIPATKNIPDNFYKPSTEKDLRDAAHAEVVSQHLVGYILHNTYTLHTYIYINYTIILTCLGLKKMWPLSVETRAAARTRIQERENPFTRTIRRSKGLHTC